MTTRSIAWLSLGFGLGALACAIASNFEGASGWSVVGVLAFIVVFDIMVIIGRSYKIVHRG